MIPCPIKSCTGYSCPGCGIQRSFFSLIELDFKNSFILYPPLLLGILFTFIFLFLKMKFKNLKSNQIIFLNLVIVLTNFLIKLIN